MVRLDLVRRFGPPPAAEVASPASVGPNLRLGLIQLMAELGLVLVLVQLVVELEVGVRSWALRLLLCLPLGAGALEGQQRAHRRFRPRRRSAGSALVEERLHLGREGWGS